jgi:type 1 glutamine amidotransferase
VKKSILGISIGLVHPHLGARSRLKGALSGYDIAWFANVEELRGLFQCPYRTVILYCHRQRISNEALKTLIGFIEGGGGLLAIHSASASFKGAAAFHRLLGGRFLSHRRIETFTVMPETEGPARFGVSESFSIRDELYLHEYGDDVDIAFSTLAGGKKEPVVWTRNAGRGRVCYIAPGHCAGSFGHPAMQSILRRGLQWAGGMG